MAPYDWDDRALAGLEGIEPYEVRRVLEEAEPRWPASAVGPGGQRCSPSGAGPEVAGRSEPARYGRTRGMGGEYWP